MTTDPLRTWAERCATDIHERLCKIEDSFWEDIEKALNKEIMRAETKKAFEEAMGKLRYSAVNGEERVDIVHAHVEELKKERDAFKEQAIEEAKKASQRFSAYYALRNRIESAPKVWIKMHTSITGRKEIRNASMDLDYHLGAEIKGNEELLQFYCVPVEQEPHE